MPFMLIMWFDEIEKTTRSIYRVFFESKLSVIQIFDYRGHMAYTSKLKPLTAELVHEMPGLNMVITVATDILVTSKS